MGLFFKNLYLTVYFFFNQQKLRQQLAVAAKALAEERLAVEYEPRAPAFHENLGNILLVTDPRAAIAEFQKLVSLGPDRAASHSDLGVAMEAAGETREAAAEYETALRLEPGDRDAQEGYRRVMARLR